MPRIRSVITARFAAALLVAGVATPALGQVPLVNADQACVRLGTRLQSVGVADCLHFKLELGDGASRNGDALMFRDFAPRRRQHIPHRVLMLGGIHGDELSSVSIVFQWMRRLEQERLQPFHWRVIPLANPDGLFASPASRVNRNGVDLNRNFPSADWNRRAQSYWKTKTGADPRRFPGKTAMSEPETRWLTEQIRQFKPDAIVSVHAPYGVLDYDGPMDPPERFGYLRLQPLGTYPGSMGNYAGVDLGIPVITLELPQAAIMPTVAQSQRIWADMLSWLDRNLPKNEPPMFMRVDQTVWANP